MADLKRYEPTEDGLSKALQDLGTDADDVAATLRTAGVTGVRKVAHCCPVANYLCQLFGTDVDPEVDDCSVLMHGWPPVEDDYGDRVPIVDVPVGVGSFVRLFDNGDYPDLETPAEEDEEASS